MNKIIYIIGFICCSCSYYQASIIYPTLTQMDDNVVFPDSQVNVYPIGVSSIDAAYIYIRSTECAKGSSYFQPMSVRVEAFQSHIYNVIFAECNQGIERKTFLFDVSNINEKGKRLMSITSFTDSSAYLAQMQCNFGGHRIEGFSWPEDAMELLDLHMIDHYRNLDRCKRVASK